MIHFLYIRRLQSYWVLFQIKQFFCVSLFFRSRKEALLEAPLNNVEWIKEQKRYIKRAPYVLLFMEHTKSKLNFFNVLEKQELKNWLPRPSLWVIHDWNHIKWDCWIKVKLMLLIEILKQKSNFPLLFL